MIWTHWIVFFCIAAEHVKNFLLLWIQGGIKSFGRIHARIDLLITCFFDGHHFVNALWRAEFF